ncbi:uncharacterized protein LOC110862663 [Folsomia candida]|uniref:Ankyrin-1 n=1 Tax=Folsomia candida TaxID=158441 RepID=A0A226CVV6_FOLCA|nr:uncharacterized protein LOC110862663 [Folsomia candida]OXA37113.1 Ankyrin-1 [Folsomia candida]
MSERRLVWEDSRKEIDKPITINQYGTMTIPTRAAHTLLERSVYLFDHGSVQCTTVIWKVCQILKEFPQIGDRNMAFLRNTSKPEKIIVSISGVEIKGLDSFIKKLQAQTDAVTVLTPLDKANRLFYLFHKIEEDTHINEEGTETVQNSEALKSKLFKKMLTDMIKNLTRWKRSPLTQLGQGNGHNLPPEPDEFHESVVLVSKLISYMRDDNQYQDPISVLTDICSSGDCAKLLLSDRYYLPHLFKLWKWFSEGGNALFLKELAHCSEDHIFEMLWENPALILGEGEYEIFSVTVDNLRKCKAEDPTLPINPPCSVCNITFPIYMDFIMECNKEDVSRMMCMQIYNFLARPERGFSIMFNNVHNATANFPLHTAARYCKASFFDSFFRPLSPNFRDNNAQAEVAVFAGFDEAVSQGLIALKERYDVAEVEVTLPDLWKTDDKFTALKKQMQKYCSNRGDNKNLLKKIKLLMKGIILNTRDHSKATPLHYAADRGNWQLIKTLCANNADSTLQDEFGSTPLHRAARRAPVEAVEYLINRVPCSCQKYKRDRSCKCNKQFVNLNSEMGTPLHQACIREGDDAVKVVQLLLKYGADINAVGPVGMGTPLCTTLITDMGPCSDIAWYLLGRRDVDIKPLFNLHGNKWSPFMLAIYGGHHKVVGKIIEKAKLSDHIVIKDLKENGITPLHLAAIRDQGAIAKLLDADGAKLTFSTDESASTLHFAAQIGAMEFLESVKQLVRREHLSNEHLEPGLTPFKVAKLYRHIKFQEALTEIANIL